MNNAVGAKLEGSAAARDSNQEAQTHNIDCNNAAVKVQGQASKTNVDANALWSYPKCFRHREYCRNGAGNEDPSSWKEFW